MDIKNIREPLIMVENSMESSSSSSEQDKDKEFETQSPIDVQKKQSDNLAINIAKS